jgi:hypothetical protein
MAGIVKPPGAFAITPHKVSVCILLQIYVPSSQMSVPFPFSSVAQHNRLGLFLLALTKVLTLNVLQFLFNLVQFFLLIYWPCYLTPLDSSEHAEKVIENL